MSSDIQLRVLCYDISSDKRRRRVAAILEDHGTRVQESVFEGRMSSSRLARIVDKVKDRLEANDSLRIYTVGKSGERLSIVVGEGAPMETATGYWLL